MKWKVWLPIAIVVILLLSFAGLLPLPGQKDNVTTHTQPSTPGTQPRVEAPTGPAPSPPSEPGRGTQPPPGGNPAAAASSTTK